jgi:hypothetical protein
LFGAGLDSIFRRDAEVLRPEVLLPTPLYYEILGSGPACSEADMNISVVVFLSGISRKMSSLGLMFDW